MTGHRSLQLLPTDLNNFLAELQTLASPLLSDGLTLKIKNHCDRSGFLIDPGMLRDSLLNLILNARDASPSNGAITVQCYTVEDTWLEFSVQDGGKGFSPSALQNALNPFFTTKGGEGSGLGLSMVYDMTKLAGGEILLSNSFQGAHVTLRLPLRTAAPSHQPGLVLLVEDNLDLRSSVRDMLTELGHSVVEASSVFEARALWDGLPDIALILSDLVLQGEETGLDLGAHALRTQTPMYFMTSLPPSHDLHQRATQIAPVIPKPFAGEALSIFLTSKDVL
jgi:CheY-like chemotaxis protein